jgi:hypothetical protein
MLTYVVIGFFSAFGWWGANKVIDHFEKPEAPTTVEKRDNR